MVPPGLAPRHASQAWQSAAAGSWQTLLRAAIYQTLSYRAERPRVLPRFTLKVYKIQTALDGGKLSPSGSLEGMRGRSPCSCIRVCSPKDSPGQWGAGAEPGYGSGTPWPTDVMAGPPATTASVCNKDRLKPQPTDGGGSHNPAVQPPWLFISP